MAILASACSGPTTPAGDPGSDEDAGVVTAATLGEQVVLPTNDYLKLPQYRNADVEYGRMLAMQCRSCHSFEKTTPSVAGPDLAGFFGRGVGTVDGYPYSQALLESDFVWTPQALDAWLAEPARFLPGNRMAWAGLRKPEHRNAVIAALLRLTQEDAMSVKEEPGKKQ
ncbi:MAG: hypothetical protein WD448_10230 [Woeseia sp.]